MNRHPGTIFLLSAAAAALVAAAVPVTASAEPLDLAGAYRLAVENDPAFRAAAATRDADLESVAIARAFLRPNLSFQAGATAVQENADPEFSGPDETYSNLSLSLNLRHPLYRPDRKVRLGQARTTEEKAGIDYAVRGQELIVRVAQAYFGVLDASDDYRFAQTNREAIAQQLRQARQRFEVGLIAITDVEEAKARFDLASAREIEARNGLDNAREALREVIGEYPDEVAPLGGGITLAMPEPADIEEWTRTALESNLNVRSASFSVILARDEIRFARLGGGQPSRSTSIDFVGSTRLTDTNRTPGGRETAHASIGVELQLPLYTGGGVEADTRQARARHRSAVHEQERARRSAVSRTRQGYLGVASAIARVEALRQAVVSSQSALDAVDAGFQVGTRTSVDVLDAQRDLFQAQNDLAGARYDYILNALALRQAAGTLVPGDLDAINEWLE